MRGGCTDLANMQTNSMDFFDLPGVRLDVERRFTATNNL